MQREHCSLKGRCTGVSVASWRDRRNEYHSIIVHTNLTRIPKSWRFHLAKYWPFVTMNNKTLLLLDEPLQTSLPSHDQFSKTRRMDSMLQDSLVQYNLRSVSKWSLNVSVVENHFWNSRKHCWHDCYICVHKIIFRSCFHSIRLK